MSYLEPQLICDHCRSKIKKNCTYYHVSEEGREYYAMDLCFECNNELFIMLNNSSDKAFRVSSHINNKNYDQ